MEGARGCLLRFLGVFFKGANKAIGKCGKRVCSCFGMVGGARDGASAIATICLLYLILLGFHNLNFGPKAKRCKSGNPVN